MTFSIRRALPDDAAAVAELAERTFVDTFAGQNRPEDVAAYLAQTYGAEIQRREIEDPNTITLIVDDAGTLIAYTQLKLSPAAVEIGRFYVDRSRHGHGVAQALMDASIAAASSTGAQRIWLGVWEKNARAIAFYAKCRFRDIGSHPFLLGSDLQTDREMERML